MTTVMVAAATAAARAALEATIAGRPGLALVTGTPGRRPIEMVLEAAPDVLVVDQAEGAAVPAWLRDLARAPRAPAVVLLTGDPGAARGAAALRGGVRAVLPRQATAAEILAAIGAVAAGLVVLHPDEVPALRPAAAPATTTHDELLTARETEILTMLAEGLGNKLIAARLGISGHTVKFHVASIFAKLGAGTRTEAVTIGLRRGLILI